MFGALGLTAAMLLWVQVVQAPSLTAEAANQRTTRLVEPATRGTIADRNGAPLAYTMEAKALTFQPQRVRAERADFSRASLANASLDDARFEHVALDESVLRGTSLRRTNLQGATLIEADLEKAVCEATDFSRADLRRARFPQAIFRETVIDGARVFATDWGQATQFSAESFGG